MLKPLPETREALAELVSMQEPDLDEVLVGLGRAAVAIVPELVGMSLGLAQGGVTLTLVASSSGLASIDAMQYLDGGPCVAVAQEDRDRIDVDSMDDLMNEDRWSLFARTSAAAGVQSTLSMPLLRGAVVIGGINLYASAPDAFKGHHEELADALGASAAAAVTNADLSFSTRERAVQTPADLIAQQAVEMAVGLLAARYGEDSSTARTRLRAAAACAGIDEALVAQVLIIVHNG